MQTNWLKQYYPNSSFTFQNGEIIYKQAVVPQSIRSAIEGQIGNVTHNNTTQEGGKKDRYTYRNGYNRSKTERELKQVDAVKYTLDLARSGLSIVERILKEMRRIIEYKVQLNNPIYTTQLNLLKGELSCLARLFVYDKVEIFNSSGWEWEIGNTTYDWDYDLDSTISGLDFTANGIGKIDKVTANIARSYYEIDAILLRHRMRNLQLLWHHPSKTFYFPQN